MLDKWIPQDLSMYLLLFIFITFNFWIDGLALSSYNHKSNLNHQNVCEWAH